MLKRPPIIIATLIFRGRSWQKKQYAQTINSTTPSLNMIYPRGPVLGLGLHGLTSILFYNV